MVDDSFSELSSDQGAASLPQLQDSLNSFNDSSFEISEDECFDKEESPEETAPFNQIPLRASTAPARPLTSLEEFRRSSDFMLLEHTVICSSQLVLRTDNKYDLDSEVGQRACKKLLNQVERMCEVFKAKTCSRQYRSEFTKAYRVLYKEGSLCHLTEILDSAQERIPHLWVNGEKYVFSGEVLEAGGKLFNEFERLQQSLRCFYNQVIEGTESVEEVVSGVRRSLEQFDCNWVEFEHLYVLELMVIEADARRFITKAIKVEKELLAYEVKAKARGRAFLENEEYTKKRAKLVEIIGKINNVANVEGKGRADLSVEILSTAEGLYRRVSATQSRAVRILTSSIRASFNGMRHLFRKYDQNIEVVDPQLKNNPDLVEGLVCFENSWEKGKSFLLNSKRCSQLIYFSQYLESLGAKHPCFKEQVECRDADLFIAIPALLILLKLEDKDKELSRRFCPWLEDENHKVFMLLKRLKRAYNFGKLVCSSENEYFELFEKAILGMEMTNRQNCLLQQFDNIDFSLHKIKTLAMELQRCKPAQWNRFLDVALC